MTFDEVMKQVQAKGTENQEIFKTCIFDDEMTGDLMFLVARKDVYISITAEQFLKIYEVLGE